jgi:hypothetical protein
MPDFASRRPMQSCIDPRIRIIVAHLKHAARRLDPIPTAPQTRRPALLARRKRRPELNQNRFAPVISKASR